MTIVGTAELDVRAVGTHFTSDVQQVVKPGMAQAGQQAEQAAGQGRKAFGLMFRTIRDSSQGAFAPVTELLGNVENVMEDIRTKSIGLRTTAIGAAGLGVGAGLQMFASKEQAAHAQLDQAIQNSGHVWEEYGGQIEDTVKHGEHYGVLAYKTMDVLNRLTVATNSPKKALADYQIVLDMAAARHMDVTSAAQMLGSAYAGNTRVFRMFGLSVSDQNKRLAEAASADKAATSAAEALKKARQNLADEEARVGAARKGHAASASQLASAEASVTSAQASADTARFQHGSASPQYTAAVARVSAAEARLSAVRSQGTTATALTVSQEISLRKAHEAVTEATKKYTDAASAKKKADEAAKGATTDITKIVGQLADKVSGQASASMDNFGGRVKEVTAQLEDQVSAFGARYGPMLTTASSGVMVLGATMTITSSVVQRFRDRNAEAAAAEVTVGNAAETSSGQVSRGSAMMAASSERNMRRMSGAIAGVVGAIGAFGIGAATSGHGAGGAVAGTLGGAVTGAIAGRSVGGPFGAAIGAAGGALVGLAGHFVGAGGAAKEASKEVRDFNTNLQAAYQADKNRAGKQTRGAINQFLQAPSNAGVTDLLAQAGVKMNQIIAGIRDPASLKSAEAQAQKAYRSGKITADEFQQLDTFIKLINGQFAGMVGTVDSIATINGQVTQHLKDQRSALHRVLTEIYIPPPLPKGERHKAPPTVSGLLTGPIPGRATGGPTYTGQSYIVGEHGPELLSMGSSSGYVHPDVRGGDGSPVVAELRALRMDVLQVVHAARSTTRAAEDMPHGVARALRSTGNRKFSSPSLATM